MLDRSDSQTPNGQVAQVLPLKPFRTEIDKEKETIVVTAPKREIVETNTNISRGKLNTTPKSKDEIPSKTKLEVTPEIVLDDLPDVDDDFEGEEITPKINKVLTEAEEFLASVPNKNKPIEEMPNVVINVAKEEKINTIIDLKTIDDTIVDLQYAPLTKINNWSLNPFNIKRIAEEPDRFYFISKDNESFDAFVSSIKDNSQTSILFKYFELSRDSFWINLLGEIIWTLFHRSLNVLTPSTFYTYYFINENEKHKIILLDKMFTQTTSYFILLDVIVTNNEINNQPVYTIHQFILIPIKLAIFGK